MFIKVLTQRSGLKHHLLQIPFSTAIEETIEQILQARRPGSLFTEGEDAQPMVML